MEDCIFDKEKVKEKIENIIGGLKKAGTAAENANNELQERITKCNQEKEALQLENKGLEAEKSTLQTENQELKNLNITLSSNSDTRIQELNKKNTDLIDEKSALEETNSNQTKEIEKLKNELETQKKTSENNMNKIISTLAAERNQLLQRLQEKADAQAKAYAQAKEDALAAQEAVTKSAEEAKLSADAKEVAEAQAKDAEQAQAKAEQEKTAAETKVTEAETKAEQAKTAAEQAQAKADRALDEAEAKASEAKEEAEKAKAVMESNKTESMRNIEKIQKQLGVNIRVIQSKLWETSKQYMKQQYGNQEFKKNIADDPFVQAELKTLLNDTTELKDAEAIQEAHENVITRHYKTLYPNASVNDVMNMELPPDIKDHIVIPPYLYLSLTDYFVVFSVTNKNINMRFLDSDGKNSDNEVSLEKGFHIIIKKLGNGTEDFFSRIDVKFVLLNTEQNASIIISQVFNESTFYGHIPTQTIFSLVGSNNNITRSGGNKTLKNNKKKLKKKKKYTQNRHIMKKLKH